MKWDLFRVPVVFRLLWCLMKLLMCGNLCPICSLLHCTMFSVFLTSYLVLQVIISGWMVLKPLLMHFS